MAQQSGSSFLRNKTGLRLCIACVFLVLLSIPTTVQAAVKFVGALGNDIVALPYGIAVDDQQYVYVADAGRHQIVRFNAEREFVTSWGQYGQAQGQFYSPFAIAVGPSGSSTQQRVFVADTFNNRVQVFTTGGTFLHAFGSEGSGNDQFFGPEGIAYLPASTGGVPQICVADTRNKRVSCFNLQGKWLKSFNCSDCPGGPFNKPVGIAIRVLDGGAIRFYVSDNYPGRIHVLNGSGKWVRSFGGPGDPVELGFPDELAVDPADESVYVVDGQFGVESVMKFDSDGKFKFSFNTGLVQPHALAIYTDRGRATLYAAPNSNSDILQFDIVPPRLHIDGLRFNDREIWLLYKSIVVRMKYNGVEEVCKIDGSFSVQGEGANWRITKTFKNRPISESMSITKALSSSEIDKLTAVWSRSRLVKVAVDATGKCPDGAEFSASDTFRF